MNKLYKKQFYVKLFQELTVRNFPRYCTQKSLRQNLSHIKRIRDYTKSRMHPTTFESLLELLQESSELNPVQDMGLIKA